MVRSCSHRRLDRIARFAPESHECANDLLSATAASAPMGRHIFFHLLLSRERRCVSKPGVAAEFRTSYPGLYQRVPCVDACNMDEHFSPNHSRGAVEYVAHGSAGC